MLLIESKIRGDNLSFSAISLTIEKPGNIVVAGNVIKTEDCWIEIYSTEIIIAHKKVIAITENCIIIDCVPFSISRHENGIITIKMQVVPALDLYVGINENTKAVEEVLISNRLIKTTEEEK